MNMWAGVAVPHWRAFGGGGLVVDWNLRTNLEGLYASGSSVFGGGAHASAATSGRYAGRTAAAYAMNAPEGIIDSDQVEEEKRRIHSHINNKKSRLGWKELNGGIARVMQDYCGEHRNEETLLLGLDLLKQLKDLEMVDVQVNNPHELAHVLECESLMTVGEMVMHASLLRKASSIPLVFSRLDYPDTDPPEWDKLLPMKLENNKVIVRELPLNYHLLPPYAATYEENYSHYCVK
jgi:succinate dehydrogenase/fumarate reductase flavoprotein subunit